MDSKAYEIRLRKEYELLQKLQGHPNVSNDTIRITIQYKDRTKGNDYETVMENPSNGLYPNSFRVTYKMPVYVGPSQLKRDWQASFLFSISEEVLMSNSLLNFEIEGKKFQSDSVPYNPEVSKQGEWFNIGCSWTIARDGYGIWLFIIFIGCLLNMEKFIMRQDNEYASSCLNNEAYKWWKYERNMQPNNSIDWPFHLNEIKDLQNNKKQKISFGIPYKKTFDFTFGTNNNFNNT